MLQKWHIVTVKFSIDSEDDSPRGGSFQQLPLASTPSPPLPSPTGGDWHNTRLAIKSGSFFSARPEPYYTHHLALEAASPKGLSQLHRPNVLLSNWSRLTLSVLDFTVDC